MKTFPFDEGQQKTFIESVLARNTRLSDSSESGILAAYQLNPYLNAYLSPIFSEVPGLKGVSPRTITSADIYQNYNFSFSKVGGGASGFANLAINAYTDYIIDAVNAEIDDAFFIHLQEALAKYPELPILFPNVMDGLSKIQVTKYKQSINLLKSGSQGVSATY